MPTFAISMHEKGSLCEQCLVCSLHCIISKGFFSYSLPARFLPSLPFLPSKHSDSFAYLYILRPPGHHSRKLQRNWLLYQGEYTVLGEDSLLKPLTHVTILSEAGPSQCAGVCIFPSVSLSVTPTHLNARNFEQMAGQSRIRQPAVFSGKQYFMFCFHRKVMNDIFS